MWHKRIANASTDGVQFMKDLRAIIADAGYGEKSFEYHWRFYDIELFFTLYAEFMTPMLLSFAAVLIVILIITSDLVATLVVTLCVIMTDIFVAGIIFYWNMTLNPIVLLQVVLGIGCSVDYSSHIAYAYLIEDVPEHLQKKINTKSAIRRYKAEKALSKMGSSVFHGGFSTWVSLSVLAPSRTYIFLAFYRMWFSIILFGMANGFLLLPVLLSLIGTVNTDMDHEKIRQEGILPDDYDLRSASSDNRSISLSESKSESSSESERANSARNENPKQDA